MNDVVIVEKWVMWARAAFAVGVAMVLGAGVGYGARDQSAANELLAEHARWAACAAGGCGVVNLECGPTDCTAACAEGVASAKLQAKAECMSRLDMSGCVPELHDLMAGTYHRKPPRSTDCSRLPDGGTWSW